MIQKNRSNGFTLIELVIAFAILAIMLSIIYGTVNGVIRAKQTLDDGRDNRAIADSVLMRLSRELQLVTPEKLLPPEDKLTDPVPPDLYLEGTKGAIDSNVRGDSIRFIASGANQYVPGSSAHTGQVQISYRVEKNPNPDDDPDALNYLVREEVPKERQIKNPYDQSTIFPITKRLVGFELRYLSSGDSKWYDSWGEEGRLKLPRMIEFTIKLQSPRGQVESFTTAVPVSSRSG